jgi:uncharacterized membrane protein
MAIFYLAAGVVHLQSPDAFLPIVPDWVPVPREVILFTGACEIAGGLGLVTRPFRWWAAGGEARPIRGLRFSCEPQARV